MKDLPFRRRWELGDKVGGGATAGPSPGNREFPDSSDTAVQTGWRLQGSAFARVFVLTCIPETHVVFFFSCKIITEKHLKFSSNKYALPKYVRYTPSAWNCLLHPWESCGGTTTANIWWRLTKTTVTLTPRRANSLSLGSPSSCSFRSFSGKSTEMHRRGRRIVHSDTFFSSHRNSQSNYSSRSEG